MFLALEYERGWRDSQHIHLQHATGPVDIKQDRDRTRQRTLQPRRKPLDPGGYSVYVYAYTVRAGDLCNYSSMETRLQGATDNARGARLI